MDLTDPNKFKLNPDKIYEGTILVLRELAKAKRPMAVSDFKTNRMHYAGINRAMKVLAGNGYAVTHSQGTNGLIVEINDAGRKLLKRIDAGEVRIMPLHKAKSGKKTKPTEPPLPRSTHDAVADAFLKQQAVPIAFNGAMNSIFERIPQLIATELDDHAPVAKPKNDLDKHNAHLHSRIEQILKLCEDDNGQA